MIKNTTFENQSVSSNATIISANSYNFVIGLTILWGFFANWLMVENIPFESIVSINPIVFFIGYLVSCFAGIFIFTKSDTPIISFLGYNLVVVPLGFVLVLALNGVDPSVIQQAIEITGLATGIMMLLGSAFPKFFNSIGKGLFIALLASIIAELIMVLIFKTHFRIMHFIMIAIFCGYIGYDWARAQGIPKTVDNAIDSAASLYMDIVLLFLRILSVLNRS